MRDQATHRSRRYALEVAVAIVQQSNKDTVVKRATHSTGASDRDLLSTANSDLDIQTLPHHEVDVLDLDNLSCDTRISGRISREANEKIGRICPLLSATRAPASPAVGV